MKRYGVWLLAACLMIGAAPLCFAAEPAAGLRVFVIDVEGGQATLFVSPDGHSLLVDTGFPSPDGRDTERILAATRQAGLTKLDALLLTHYHLDHVGGVKALLARIPVDTIIDHGRLYAQDPEMAPGDPRAAGYADYLVALGATHAKHVAVKAGDKLPVPGFDGVVFSSSGKVISKPLPGAGQKNPLCANAPVPAEDLTENGQSIGIVLRYGGETILDAGDLTADRERKLVCPSNLIGHIDLVIVSHHGGDLSNSHVFVHSLRPRVAIMDNGDKKGGSTSVIDTFRSSPGPTTLYQLHLAPAAGTPQRGGTSQQGPEHNTPEPYIANLGGVDGKRIDAVLNANGTMDVTNQRTGVTVRYDKPAEAPRKGH